MSYYLLHPFVSMWFFTLHVDGGADRKQNSANGNTHIKKAELNQRLSESGRKQNRTQPTENTQIKRNPSGKHKLVENKQRDTDLAEVASTKPSAKDNEPSKSLEEGFIRPEYQVGRMALNETSSAQDKGEWGKLITQEEGQIGEPLSICDKL